MDILMQVAGTFGLIETLVEFAYVVTHRENFTPFEEAFFLTSGCLEMLGEVLFLVVGVWTFFGKQDSQGIEALLQDPIHNCAINTFAKAAGKEEDIRWDILNGSSVAIAVSVLSVPLWGTFWPIWGSRFRGDGDAVLELALSSCSLGLVYMLVRVVRLGGAVGVPIFIMYAMQKAFEVYILLADLERLCPGDLGRSLVAFQLTEILSAAISLACVVWVDRRNCGQRKKLK